MEFDWQESQDKKKHFYVYAGYCNDRLGFVSYRQNGWKAKSYMPGAWHRVCGDLDEAKAFVEDQIKAFLDAVSAQGENWIDGGDDLPHLIAMSEEFLEMQNTGNVISLPCMIDHTIFITVY